MTSPASEGGEAARIRARLADLAKQRAALEARLAALQDAPSTAPDGDPAGSPVTDRSPSEAKIALFRSLFAGREDVFPRRWENARTSKAGYAPACANEWKPGLCGKPRVRCGACPNQAFLPVTDEEIAAHLRGRHTIGVYRASDALMSHRAAIEAHLFDRATDLFGLRSTVTLYDLTNTFFEGAAAAQPKAERGHSKEKRSDCPLLTLGLVLDGSGFVRRSEVFSGAVNENRTLASMLGALGAPADALVVMDAGIATEVNIAWLRDNGYRYLAVSRERTRRFDPELALAIETRSRQTVHVHKVVDAEGGEARLYCYSEARAKKEQGIANRFAARFEGELKKLHDGLSRPRTRKRLDRVWQRIGRIREKSRGAGAHYDIDVIADESGANAHAVTWKRRPLAGTMITHPGVYCLRTNVEDWDEEALWRTYTSLTDVEAVFRSLKSELGLRPIFHQTQRRSDGHLFITVIAYQMVQTIRRRLGEQGESESWTSLRRILEGQHRVTATFQRKDGRTLHVRKATRAEPRQQEIYRALALDPAPGGIRKMIV